MDKIDHIFFDLGGVLYTLNYESVWNGFCEISRRSVEEVKGVLYADDIFIGFEKGEISAYQYYGAVKERLSCSLNFDEFRKIWNSVLIKRDDMFQLVKGLKEYFKILILSNINELNAGVINGDIEGIAHDIVFSYKVGCMKPDPGIYGIALRKAMALPENTIFIDDDERNIETSRAIGIHSHLYRDKSGLLKFLESHGIKVTDNSFS